jgi:hypothetical protein
MQRARSRIGLRQKCVAKATANGTAPKRSREQSPLAGVFYSINVMPFSSMLFNSLVADVQATIPQPALTVVYWRSEGSQLK